MYLSLLDASVSMNVNEMATERLLIVAGFFLAIIALILINGFSIKLGDKEINIGVIKRYLVNREKDMLLKEALKKFSDDVDHEVNANLYDLVEDLEDQLVDPLIIGDHCYFTFEKFTSLVKSELYKRIRRNSLWEKLSDAGKDRYIAIILKDIGDRYETLRAKADRVKCGDTYAEFKVIKGAIREVLAKFFDGTSGILVAGMRKKILKYNASKKEFKTAEARKICCDDCIEKNKERIEKLTGRPMEPLPPIEKEKA